ncbi:TIGR01457 family HAD-type hydrolase [Levilactobacillus bambusae]|uniref:Acid sugar phosphatase n=1 Tax=Levilactobacillus bambusae TaxID=2024736 RepID=A0A2V1MX66_9LACO|nr:TIGR01457 family HAD-type hydrolase [Levilactobacillus bambusae]PWF99616.1 TIGR01457 family HAD-type hydrolase [Levilactobacillus bambusae]
MTKYKAYFIDLDGTIYAGKTRYPAAKRFIERLQAAGTPFLFVTNNTTKLPEDVVKNLADNHDIHVSVDNVYTAGLATADYLDEQATSGPRTVYVIGEAGLKRALLAKRFIIDEVTPRYVVVGLDSDATYHKFATATLAIQRGATFIGTNSDSNIPKEQGLMPGAGSLVKMVEYATQQRAFYIGKPEAIIMTKALSRMNLRPEDVVMVGDNYNTDIKAGQNVGMDTLLVYTGVSTPEQMALVDRKPTHAIKSLDDWKLD